MSQLVITQRTSLMQSIADYVRLGYHHYTIGVVSPDRAAAWARKAALYYCVDLDRNRRARARRAGEGCAVLLMHEHEPGQLMWILLVTDGSHPAHSLEHNLRDAWDRRSRLTLFECYELVRMTRQGSAHPSWTWRIGALAYQAQRSGVIHAVRRGDARTVHQLIRSIFNTVKFAGCRKQIGALCALLRAEWARVRGKAPLPELPKKLPYLARLKIQTVPLHVWLSIARQQTAAATGNPRCGGQDRTDDSAVVASVGDELTATD